MGSRIWREVGEEVFGRKRKWLQWLKKNMFKIDSMESMKLKIKIKLKLELKLKLRSGRLRRIVMTVE